HPNHHPNTPPTTPGDFGSLVHFRQFELPKMNQTAEVGWFRRGAKEAGRRGEVGWHGELLVGV
ncbi:MAG: hypothetical protein FWD83_10980, partial [Promicromonosporaceae bacterium]|nr:hypothetical protein [Promicromonosporaceae bacterium]